MTTLTANTRTDQPAGEAGRIKVYANGDIAAPLSYLRSESFEGCIARINDGSHVLLRLGPTNVPPLQLVAVILQTDYAAWAGKQDLLRGWAPGQTQREIERQQGRSR